MDSDLPDEGRGQLAVCVKVFIFIIGVEYHFGVNVHNQRIQGALEVGATRQGSV